METINWVEHEEKGNWKRPNLVAYTLIEAMAEKAGINLEEVFQPFDPKALNVELRVNGVDVPFVGVMDKIQKAIELLEQEVRSSIIKDAARELIEELSVKVGGWE